MNTVPFRAFFGVVVDEETILGTLGVRLEDPWMRGQHSVSRAVQHSQSTEWNISGRSEEIRETEGNLVHGQEGNLGLATNLAPPVPLSATD